MPVVEPEAAHAYRTLSNEEIHEVFEALRLATEAERQRMRPSTPAAPPQLAQFPVSGASQPLPTARA